MSRSSRWKNTLALALGLLCAAHGTLGIGQDPCVAFEASASTFAVVSKNNAVPVLVSPDEWPGVQRAASDFVADVEAVTGVKPKLRNITVTSTGSSFASYGSSAVIVGTLGKSSLVEQVVNNTGLEVSSVEGRWEAFLAREVTNPLPGIEKAYVIVGADKRGTIFALYEHSEQFGACFILPDSVFRVGICGVLSTECFLSTQACLHGTGA